MPSIQILDLSLEQPVLHDLIGQKLNSIKGGLDGSSKDAAYFFSYSKPSPSVDVIINEIVIY